MFSKIYNFFIDSYLSYNRFLYNLLYKNSIGGKRISDDSNMSYNVYTAYTFILFLLLTYIYLNSGYSYQFITGVIAAAYASFFAFSNFLVRDYDTNEGYDGWNTLKKFIPSLILSLIVVLVCFYFSGNAITITLLKNIFYFITSYTLLFYFEGFVAYSIIYVLTIDYPNMFEGKGFTFKHIISYIIVCFFAWLVNSMYNNIIGYGMEWGYWVFSIDSLFYIYKILAFIIFGLIVSSWFVGVVETLNEPKNKNASNWVHVFLSILVIMTICYNNFFFYLFGMIVIYFVFFYVIKKIIPDYLKSYKYLDSILYLVYFLFFLTFIII